jgi:hypothetical protein
VEDPDAAVLPIQVVSSRPGVEMRVNGRSFTLLLDTGAPVGVLLSGKMATAAGVDSKPVPGISMGGVMMADVETEVGEIARMELGPFAFERVPVVVAPRGWFNQGFPGDSVFGFDVLAQFTVRIDYPRRRIWLRRTPEARMTFLGGDARVFRESGALLVPDPLGLLVDVVLPGSTAAQRGLVPGDYFPGDQGAEAIGAALAGGEALPVMRRAGASRRRRPGRVALSDGPRSRAPACVTAGAPGRVTAGARTPAAAASTSRRGASSRSRPARRAGAGGPPAS